MLKTYGKQVETARKSFDPVNVPKKSKNSVKDLSTKRPPVLLSFSTGKIRLELPENQGFIRAFGFSTFSMESIT